jgi:predicted negative regulator of RcsB-dependent stress response
MEDDAYEEEPAAEPNETTRHNGFWPLLLIGLSLVMVLGWELWVAVATQQIANQLLDQQAKVVAEAKQVQGNLEKLARGLVELAKTDDEAKAIVNKFSIKINTPGVTAASPTP